MNKKSQFTMICIIACINTLYANEIRNNQNINNDFVIQSTINTRYEAIKNDIKKDTEALTAKLNVNINDKIDDRFTLEAEANIVKALIDDYNWHRTINDNPTYFTVKDPETQRFTKLNITYNNDKYDINTKIGRQKLFFDNGRIISDQQWRQTPQTFDAISINGKYNNLSYNIVRTTKINAVVDESTKKTNSVLLRLNYKTKEETNNISISTVKYMFDNENNTDGFLFNGNYKYNANLLYNFEWYRQYNPTIGQTSTDISAKLINYSLGINLNNITLVGGVQTSKNGFSTVYGANFIYTGLADTANLFSPGKVEDRYIKFDTKLKKIGQFEIDYHNFDASDSSGKNLGKEFDFIYKNKLTQHTALAIIVANYKKGDVGYDNKKSWLQVNYAF